MMLETCKPQKYEGTLTKLLGVLRGQARRALSPRWNLLKLGVGFFLPQCLNRKHNSRWA